MEIDDLQKVWAQYNKKVKILSNIDHDNAPIIDLQKSQISFDKLFLKCKKVEFILFPMFCIVTAPILAMGLRGFNILEHWGRYSIAFLCAMALFYTIVIWIC